MGKVLLFFFFAISILQANETTIQQRELKNEQERLMQLQESIPNSNINLQSKNKHDQSPLILDETPCFVIDDIVLADNKNDKFTDYLERAIKKVKFKKGQCLGKQSITALHSAFSNEIISNGFITTSITIPTQNIHITKTLKFEVKEGKIDEVFINDSNSTSSKISSFMAFGGSSKDKNLNLRDIEQALQTLQNSSNSKVGVELVPSSRPNFTNINITKQKSFPMTLQLGFDNLGSDVTGKYQASASIYGLNLLGLNEILYLSSSKNIFSGDKQSVGDESQKGKNQSIYHGATLPFGKFLLDFNENRYDYDQAIAGAYGVYKYSGKSKTRNLTLNYLYHRDQSSKNSIYFRLWERKNKNYIQDYELTNQRRKTAGYEVGLSSHFFIENGFTSAGISYKKGTGARGSIKAPEQEWGGGTSRFEKYLANFNFHKSSNVAPLTYDLKAQIMWNKTPLTMQERMNLGGYYSVRGFDGEMSIVGDRGFFIRNTVEYGYLTRHKIYLAFDMGKVTSKDSAYDSSSSIAGTGVGLKGSFNAGGALGYDLFVGKALNKPEYFKTDKVAINFSLTYTL